MLVLPPPFSTLLLSPWRFAWHPATRTAILSDVHLGAEKSLAAAGIYLPSDSTAAIHSAWSQLVQLSPARVIIAGDLFDSPAPDNHTIDIFQALLAQLPPACTVTLTPGNHDPDPAALAPVFPQLDLQPITTLAHISILHGHQPPPTLPPTTALIVGHQHPAVTLSTRIRSAKMICAVTTTTNPRPPFSPGLRPGENSSAPAPSDPSQPNKPSKSREAPTPLLILPAFSRLPLGSNLLNQSHWILALPRPTPARMRIAGYIEPANASPQVLDFGPLDALRSA